MTDEVALTRIAWTALPTSFYRAGPDDIDDLLAGLAGAGVATVNVHGLTSVEVDGTAGCRQVGGDGAGPGLVPRARGRWPDHTISRNSRRRSLISSRRRAAYSKRSSDDASRISSSRVVIRRWSSSSGSSASSRSRFSS